MKNKILERISKFFELDEESEEDKKAENEVIEETQVRTEKYIELSVVIDFIRELEAYYTNDLFKQKANYINSILSDDQKIFLKKKIQEYEIAVKLIAEIKDGLLHKERECKELWGKTSYSFYNELEKVKLKTILDDTFNIVKQIVSINVVPELDEIIIKRLEMYKNSWKIDCTTLPKNTSLRIVERKGKIETYQFGDFRKEIIDVNQKNELLPAQLSAIKKIEVQILFQEPAVDSIWIRCTAIERQQLEYLKRSTFFLNDWENGIENEIVYDIVKCCDIEDYIRAILQLLLARKSYVIISIINPNSNIFQLLKDTVEVDIQNSKVRVVDQMAFLLPERTGVYGDNLQFECVSRKQKLEKLSFCSFKDFVDNFLKGT